MDVGGKGGHVTSVRQNEKKIIRKYEKSKLSEKICLEKKRHCGMVDTSYFDNSKVVMFDS